jgi:hypothetical protein
MHAYKRKISRKGFIMEGDKNKKNSKKIFLSLASVFILLFGTILYFNVRSPQEKVSADGIVYETFNCVVGSDTVCPKFNYSGGNLQVKITLRNGADVPYLYVKFGETLDNYEDAYLKTDEKTWNCGSPGTDNSHTFSVGPGADGSYTITFPVEAKHKVALTHYTVQSVYVRAFSQTSVAPDMDITYTPV